MFSRLVVSQMKHNSFFVVGVALGLCVSLAVIPLEEEPAVACPAAGLAPGLAPVTEDEFEPHREERPAPAAAPPARPLQRPRYYTTELGIRGSLMSGVLTSSAALDAHAGALNATAARLQPLRLFVAAAPAPAPAAPPRPNVVGFTDSREMLKPFNALKYLADNYLEEFDFFFLVSDTSYVNARRLQALVAGLSVSQDVYMGVLAEDDSHYCTLEGGIVLSNSVVRAAHASLDWCVRNSYSARHHENLGRCLTHAAHVACTPRLMGQQYQSLELKDDSFSPELADAVTAHPVTEPERFYQLHAYVSRVYLERDAAEVGRLRAALARGAPRLPPAARPPAWPPGLRAEPGPLPAPPTRFDHIRWTWTNMTHALMPDDHRAVAPLTPSDKEALQLVSRAAESWARRAWGVNDRVTEAAWRWEPPHALRYRLTLHDRMVECARPLGAARLAPAPYVTESARLTLLLPLRAPHAHAHAPHAHESAPHAHEHAPHEHAATAFLKRYESVALLHDRNTALVLVIIRDAFTNETAVEAIKESASALAAAHHGAQIDVIVTDDPGGDDPAGAAAGEEEGADRAIALKAALGRLPRDALLLLLPADADFSQDLLNRARMNSIPGVQWWWAGGFTRHAHHAHPRLAADARAHHTGRFALSPPAALAVHRADLHAALSQWAGAPLAPVEQVLWAAGLRCLRAPEPALVRAPPPPPCGLLAGGAPNATAACLRARRGRGRGLGALGDRQTLARLLLEERANAEL